MNIGPGCVFQTTHMDFYLQRIKNIYHFICALIAMTWYGNPSKKINVIGVTGTDGKTTTTALIYHILKSSGKRVSMISTVAAVVGNQTYDTGFHVTTPSAFSVQKYLKIAVDQSNEYFVLETTSHSLDQYRVYGVDFKIGLITNITHEHLLYHKTYEHYAQAKTKLINWAKKGIINRDDGSYEYIVKYTHDKRKLLTYGLLNKSDYQLDIQAKIGMNLAHFNRYNYLAAYAVCHELGIEDMPIFEAMKTYKLPPGRMEVIFNQQFMIINDFAHTPNAIHEALLTLKEGYPHRRIIHIFGAAAFRDDTKRPMMGRESATFANMSIITEEDYRTEDPQKIAREIGAGFMDQHFKLVEPVIFGTEEKTFTVINDRAQAIEKALDIVKPGDIIILTGKGHEQSLCRGTTEYPWNDTRGVQDALQKRNITS
ncbi:UDP-N-acetylmuramoyl-L-alanyl-D-glutamate--2,6-diaminopimelate ligase [soil metagenome]